MLDWKSAGGEVTELGAVIPESATDEAKKKLLDLSEQMTVISEELAIETARRVVKEITTILPHPPGPLVAQSDGTVILGFTTAPLTLDEIFEHDPDPSLAYEIMALADDRLGMRSERQKNSQAPTTSSEAEAMSKTTISVETVSEESSILVGAV